MNKSLIPEQGAIISFRTDIDIWPGPCVDWDDGKPAVRLPKSTNVIFTGTYEWMDDIPELNVLWEGKLWHLWPTKSMTMISAV